MFPAWYPSTHGISMTSMTPSSIYMDADCLPVKSLSSSEVSVQNLFSFSRQAPIHRFLTRKQRLRPARRNWSEFCHFGGLPSRGRRRPQQNHFRSERKISPKIHGFSKPWLTIAPVLLHSWLTRAKYGFSVLQAPLCQLFSPAAPF